MPWAGTSEGLPLALPLALGAANVCARCRRCGWLDRPRETPSPCANCGLPGETLAAREPVAHTVAPPAIFAVRAGREDFTTASTAVSADDPIATSLALRLVEAGLDARLSSIALARALLGGAVDGMAVLCDAPGSGRRTVASLAAAEFAAWGEADAVLALVPAGRTVAMAQRLAQLGVRDAVIERHGRVTRPGPGATRCSHARGIW